MDSVTLFKNPTFPIMKRQIHLLLAATCSLSAMAQVPANVPTSGLVAWYPFNGGGTDASGTGNDATNNGATFEDDRFGNPDAAASFDGASSYFTVASPTFQLSYSGAFTYSMWVNKQTQPAAGIVMMTGTSAAGNFISLVQGGTSENFQTTMQGSTWTTITCVSTLDTWDNYVGTYDGGAMNWYKNGVLQGSATSPYSSAVSANLPLFIGKGIGAGYFLGAIDDIGIWNRALTVTEIAGLYDMGTTHVAETSASQNMSISPNPASDRIILNVDASLVGAQYDLYDATGRVVMSGKISSADMTLDVSGIRPGTCSVRVTSNDQTFTKAVIIQR